MDQEKGVINLAKLFLRNNQDVIYKTNESEL